MGTIVLLMVTRGNEIYGVDGGVALSEHCEHSLQDEVDGAQPVFP